MNPIALILILTGIYLFFRGISLFRGNRKWIGILFSILGLAAMAIPFAVSYFLSK